MSSTARTADRKNHRPAKLELGAELEAIYNPAPVGLCVYGKNLRYLRIKDRLAVFESRWRDARGRLPGNPREAG